MKQQRNAPCSCGSGKKFKKCCLLAKWEADRQAEIQLIERIGQKGIDDTLKAQAEERPKAEAIRRRGRSSLMVISGAIALGALSVPTSKH